MSALRNDDIRETFAGLDKLLVHGFEYTFITLNNLLCGTATLDHVTFHDANESFIGIGIYEEPEHLFVAHKDVMVAPRDTVIVIDTEAQTVIDTYYLQIRVKGIQHATTNANAVISGLSPSNRFALNLRTEDPSGAVCFPLIASKDTTITDEPNDVMCAVFNTFGKIPEVTSNLHATFSVVDTGGNLQTLDVNLDDVFKKKEAIENHWLIIDQVIWEIEDPNVNPQPGGNGGFQPIVDDWEEEHGEIIL